MSVFLPMAALLGGGAALDVADVFSTDLWTGNSSTQSITNGIDLSTEGGLTWIKSRSAANPNGLFDTLRGATKPLRSDTNGAELTEPTTLTGFNSDGFSLSSDSLVNNTATTYVGWSFRKAPKFFDVVTYTGNGTSNRAISHNLGQTPGMIIVKRTDSSGDWWVYHRGIIASDPNGVLNLNSTQASSSFNGQFVFGDETNLIEPTNSVFTVTSVAATTTNISSATYVAYLFAHDTSDSGIIQCGSYTGNGSSSGPTVTLGWEPQWLLIKRTDSTSDWRIYDNQRSPSNPRSKNVWANLSNAENDSSVYDLDFTSTGFQPKNTNIEINASGGSYIYMAIRAEGA